MQLESIFNLAQHVGLWSLYVVPRGKPESDNIVNVKIDKIFNCLDLMGPVRNLFFTS